MLHGRTACMRSKAQEGRDEDRDAQLKTICPFLRTQSVVRHRGGKGSDPPNESSQVAAK